MVSIPLRVLHPDARDQSARMLVADLPDRGGDRKYTQWNVEDR